MIHALKTAPQFFEDIASGKKLFEVRIDDRPYCVGDYLALNEYWSDQEYTGRCMLVRVTYALRDKSYCKENYVTLGIEPAAIWTRDSYFRNREPQVTTEGVQIYDRTKERCEDK